MKILSVTLLLILFAFQTFAKDVYVEGYTRKNGTYVQGHYRSEPNGSKLDNYSTKGNINPYTGKKGTVKSEKNKNWGDSNSFGGNQNNSFLPSNSKRDSDFGF